MDFSAIENELRTSQIKTADKYVGISESTIKGYMSKLKYLFKETNNFAGLHSYILSNWSKQESSVISYQSAVLGLAKHSETFRNMVSGELEAIKKSNTELYEKKRNGVHQVKTPKENENWVDLPELLKLTESEKYLKLPVQDQLLYDIYTMVPPARLDYHALKIVRGDFIDDLNEEKINMLRLYKKSGRWKSVIILNDYKTDQTYGTIEFDLPKKITDKILTLKENVYLFEPERSKIPHSAFKTPETFANHLRNVFETVTGKKRMSVDLLRHIYITNFRKGEKSKAQKDKLAKIMGNSPEIQELYRKIK
jgi:hypothetical protein